MEKAKAYIKSSLATKPDSPTLLRKSSTPAQGDDVRVCFVCGGTGFSDHYTIRVKPDAQVNIYWIYEPRNHVHMYLDWRSF